MLLIKTKFNDLFDGFFNSNLGSLKQFPKENDPNFNKEIEEVETDTHLVKNEVWKSLDGTSFYKRTVMESKSMIKQKSLDVLNDELKLAIDSQNFEKAIELRDEIKRLS